MLAPLNRILSPLGIGRPLVSADEEIDPDLVLWLKTFTSTVATDSSGNANDGTIFGEPSIVSGPNGGQALDFDGSVYINCGAAESLADIQTQGGITIGGITISCWLKPVSSYPILGKNGTNFGWLRFELQGSGRIGFLKDGTTDLFARATIDSWLANTWQHIAITWDGSETASNIGIYRNGASKTHDLNADGAGFFSDASLDLLIGKYASTTVGAYYHGLLADFRIYKRVLTPTETSTLYTDGAK